MAEYVHRSVISANAERVFNWHRSPRALKALIPPWEPVKVEKAPGSLAVGETAVLVMRIGPFSKRWVARHTELIDRGDQGGEFTDEQTSGPFASWVHRHSVRSDGPDRCVLEDHITYRLPGGRVGELVAGWFVRRKLRKMFVYRHRATRSAVVEGEVVDNPYLGQPKLAWARGWLAFAAIYNIVWGGAVALAPTWTLGLLGIAPATTELWPQLWACIGMIVGVYGVGYAIASLDPIRHWPIVLVGLLGKLFGPIGFLSAAMQGQLPWSMGVTILTNDLLWWIPFTMILWHAARASQPTPPRDAVSLDLALEELRDELGRSLRSLTDERPTLTVLLRHTGCTFCRQTLSDLSGWQEQLRQAGLNLAVVGMSPNAEGLREIGDRHGLNAVSYFADPDRKLYRALELRRGSFLQLFGPMVWVRGIAALLSGHGIGKLEGDGFQMPGAFVIHGGRVLRAYRHNSAADRPDLMELACPIT